MYTGTETTTRRLHDTPKPGFTGFQILNFFKLKIFKGLFNISHRCWPPTAGGPFVGDVAIDLT
eukprot:10329512-Karenia_brevis.AAC.1